MPVAIEFFLDETSAQVVRGIWRQIAEAGISAHLHTSGVRPHLSLAVGARLDGAAVEARLRDFAARTPSLPIAFAGVETGAKMLVGLIALTRPYVAQFAGSSTNTSIGRG